jgi:hypothetical protein
VNLRNTKDMELNPESLATDNSVNGDFLQGKKMDRRVFFQKLCALYGAIVIPAGILSAGCTQGGGTGSTDISLPDTNTTTPTSSTITHSKQAFQETIDTVFSVTYESTGVVDLQLNFVADETFIPEADQFSISLSGPEFPVLEEDSYAVYNDNLGDFDLYIQPGSARNGQQHYVAVFSLLNTDS